MEKEREFCLTTVDNPYDPYTHFDEWYQYDITHGSEYYGQPYDCLGLVARLANTSEEMSDAENDDEINNVIERIVRDDPIGMYCKRYKKDSSPDD